MFPSPPAPVPALTGYALIFVLFGSLFLITLAAGAVDLWGQAPTPSRLNVICDMEAGVVCFRDGAAMSCLPQSQVEPICPVGP